MCRDKQYQDEGKLKHLAEMLWYADQAYEGESERTLSKRLEKRGARAPLILIQAEHEVCIQSLPRCGLANLDEPLICRQPEMHRLHIH